MSTRFNLMSLVGGIAIGAALAQIALPAGAAPQRARWSGTAEVPVADAASVSATKAASTAVLNRNGGPAATVSYIRVAPPKL